MFNISVPLMKQTKNNTKVCEWGRGMETILKGWENHDKVRDRRVILFI